MRKLGAAISALLFLWFAPSTVVAAGTGTYDISTDRGKYIFTVTSGSADARTYEHPLEAGQFVFDGNGGGVTDSTLICEAWTDTRLSCPHDLSLDIEVHLSAGNDKFVGGRTVFLDVIVLPSDGDDDITTGFGDDVVTGGPGTDVFVTWGGDDAIDARDGNAESITCGEGKDGVRVDANDTVASDCEAVGDMDVDGVPDGKDDCRVLDGDSTNGCPNIAETLALSYASGALRAELDTTPLTFDCQDERKIVFFKKRAGPDKKLGTVLATLNGVAQLPIELTSGKYYAKAKPVTIPAVGDCLGAASNLLVLPA